MNRLENPGSVEARTLRTITDLRQQEMDIQAGIRSFVASARRQGISWALIGVALGVSRQSAQQTYKHVARSEVNPGATMIAID